MTGYTEETLPVSVIKVDERIQRNVLRHKVDKIKRDFNPDALGVLTISKRENGDLYCVDGGHRLRAVKELTDDQGTVPCHVFKGLTLAEEAKMFLELNYTTKLHNLDQFRAREVAEDEAAVEIARYLRAYGWTISKDRRKEGNVAAVAAVERIYWDSIRVDAQPNLVQVATLIITRAWGLNRDGMAGALFEGLGRVLAEHGNQIELESIVRKLKSYPGGPHALLRKAEDVATMYRLKPSMGVARLVIEEYNRGRRSNALPAWNRRR